MVVRFFLGLSAISVVVGCIPFSEDLCETGCSGSLDGGRVDAGQPLDAGLLPQDGGDGPDAGDAGFESDAGHGQDPADAGTCTPGFKVIAGASLIGNSAALIGARTIELGDFNNDGRLDAVAALPGSEVVYVVEGQGDGTFIQRQSITGITNLTGVAVGDVNRDGRLDFAFSRQSANASVYLGLGNMSFGNPFTVDLPLFTMAVALVDVDGDSKIDLAAPSRSSTYGDVYFSRGDGLGAFAARTKIGVSKGLLAFVAADLDGDGRTDFAATRGSSEEKMWVSLQGSSGSFASPVGYSVGKTALAIAAGDFDGNHRSDLVVANHDSNTITVLLNSGSGTFPLAQTIATSAGPGTVITADLDGDGDTDIAVGGSTVTIHWGDGRGTFPSTTVLNRSASSVAVGDVDGNGQMDLVMLHGGGLTTALRGCW